MTMGDANSDSASMVWHSGEVSRVPYAVYSVPALYRRELERLFYRGHWCYVGLEAEIPRAGDFKRSWIGERSVIMVRNHDNTIHVVENRCAHRGVQFCQHNFGNARTFTCPYHQWNYDLTGKLLGLPFRRGIKRDGRIEGGMPPDFKLEEHGLSQLKVAARGGVIFASFDTQIPSFEEYLGAEVLTYFDRVFNGRPLTVLGYSRQRIPGNWKLMQENIKDPYHPGLLHTWFVTFGLWRADQESRMVMDPTGRHACMISKRNSGGQGEVTEGVTSFKNRMKLDDERVLEVVQEPFWNGPSVVMTTVFPSLIIQQQVNSLSTRHIVPRGPGAFDFIWTHFGFADDTPEMTRRRVRQANLFGPAGYVSADDGEVIEMAQQGAQQNPDEATVSQLDGHDVRHTEHMVTETLIRGMYRYYREVMEL
jgi:salicylate 5-hydroxylase large subunit